MERIISIVTCLLFVVPFCAFIVLRDAELTEARNTPIKDLKGEVTMYYTPTCGACKFMAPIAADVAAKGFPIKTVNIHQNQEAGSENKIRAVPTFIYAKDGEEQFRHAGCLSANELEDMCRGIE